ncbi:MAG: hypothetical protein WD801_12450 [Gemmatimonadaceae bacterium]
MRPFMVLMVSLSCVALFPGASASQTVHAPEAGTRGLEAGIGSGGSGSLLRFTSPAAAWVHGLSASYLNVVSTIPSFTGGTETRTVSDFALIDLSFGRRRYGAIDRAVRPFNTLGVTVGTGFGTGAPRWSGGVFADLGMSYFVTEHAILSAGWIATMSYSTGGNGSGVSFGNRQVRASVSGPRLMFALYF